MNMLATLIVALSPSDFSESMVLSVTSGRGWVVP